MKKFEKVYIEITNICNLSCSFCPGHSRAMHTLTREEFREILEKVSPQVKNVFFHLMGEPTLHPLLPDFVTLAKEKGHKTIITTNGTLLGEKGDKIIASKPYRVNISLHSFEANEKGDFEEYLENCFSFAKKAGDEGIFCIFRLWNEGGMNKMNDDILKRAEEFFGNEKILTEKGFRIYDRVFVEFGDKFDWQLPDDEASEHAFCLGLRDQIGILSNGNVVPCCLDNNSDMTLGNIFEDSLENIVTSPRAKRMIDGFSRRIAIEEKCKKCGYRRKFD